MKTLKKPKAKKKVEISKPKPRKRKVVKKGKPTKKKTIKKKTTKVIRPVKVQTKKKLSRIGTGISGYDRLVEGGFERESINLIRLL